MYSKYHISRNFNKYVGLSLSEYVLRRKLSEGALMIKNTNKSIGYISDFLGFSSQKYFSSSFKNWFKVSPSIYQKHDVFIDLQLKRIINGGKEMLINEMDNLMIEILSKSSNQNELQDSIALIDNCLLYKQNNSLLELVVFIESKNTFHLYQVDLDLMNGKYQLRQIFSTQMNENVEITSIYKENNVVHVVFKDVKTGKLVNATLYDFPKSRVQIMTNVIKPIKSKVDYEQEGNNWSNVIPRIERDINDLLNKSNSLEVGNFIDADDSLICLKSFGKEYVLIKLVQAPSHIGLFSIYLDMEKKIHELVSIYTTYNSELKITFKKEEYSANIYEGNVLHSKSSIYMGNKLAPTIAIRFENGVSGTGTWSLTSCFG